MRILNLFKSNFIKRTLYVSKPSKQSTENPIDNLLMAITRGALFFEAMSEKLNENELNILKKSFSKAGLKIPDKKYLKRTSEIFWDLASQIGMHDRIGVKKGEVASDSFQNKVNS